ncbi:DUF456 domain-containing protein [Pseudochryseolinea flava]|uniref:DUF456 domain-containing protein n=1 Tax=Pseudochryseolinea flava TaxID=2059302 RepID=A0A364Y8Y3_9BACT|nr:DUF456 domain-containing protein [Pseudochryseolinea flava]RAW02829.1 DUF456 domain-containing protein [Pseudochryseolinea flava]
MDWLWLTLGILCMLGGIAGSVLPFLPGPPLCFVGLLLQQLKTDPPFTAEFLWVWAGITIAITILDYYVPIYGTKKFGGSTYGVWGCTIGLVIGIFFGALGIIFGPFIGAFIGELIANTNTKQAWRAAFGSFVGFLVGTLIKLVACFVMSYYFIKYTIIA